jgi:hypothetical protein
MKPSQSFQKLGLALCVLAAGFTVGGCNTTKATVDTTVNFFSSTSPNELFTSDGMVLKEQKINLFAGVAYENLRQEAAAGGGQYVSALAALYDIPVSRQAEFGQVLQRKHADLFVADLEQDYRAHLNMVAALNRELTAAAFLP